MKNRSKSANENRQSGRAREGETAFATMSASPSRKLPHAKVLPRRGTPPHASVSLRGTPPHASARPSGQHNILILPGGTPPSGCSARQNQTTLCNRKPNFLRFHTALPRLQFRSQHVSQHSRSKTRSIRIYKEE